MNRLLAALAAFGIPTLALAQEAAEVVVPKVSSAAQLGFSLYEMIIAPMLAIVIPWLGMRLASWLKTKTKNEMIGGATSRMVLSIASAVKMVNQTVRHEIEKAKDPTSPGGVDITEAEAVRMKEAVWDALKSEYGGMVGIEKALAVLGLSDVAGWVNREIEAVVHDLNREPAPLR